jgi:hypothetical protein
MLDKGTPPARLLTKETRPDLYALLAKSWADNDNERAFRAAYRRKHWFLASIAWCAESNWRMAGMIGAAILLGLLANVVLP